MRGRSHPLQFGGFRQRAVLEVLIRQVNQAEVNTGKVNELSGGAGERTEAPAGLDQRLTSALRD